MTETRYSAADALGTVEKSPRAVAAKDKDAWVSIFAAYSIVEDPVGSRPHISGVYDARSGKRGNAPLARFFDTFIAPNNIVFDVQRDIVCGYHVVRDLTIEISMGTSVKVKVPMHLLYVLGEQGGKLRVFRLAAHWELLPMVGQAMSFGLSSVSVMAALGWRMLRLQGLGGVLGFCRALSTVGKRGKRSVEAFAVAYNSRDLEGMETLFDAEPAGLAWPAPGSRCGVREFMAGINGQISFSKLLASGHVVSASCEWRDGEQLRHGVVIFEFTRKRAIDRISAYWGDDQAASSPAGS